MISECVTKSSITADTAFQKIKPCRGVQLFAHTCQPTLNACTICPLPLEAGRGWMATLYSCAYVSMIHHVTATGDTSPSGAPNSGT